MASIKERLCDEFETLVYKLTSAYPFDLGHSVHFVVFRLTQAYLVAKFETTGSMDPYSYPL